MEGKGKEKKRKGEEGMGGGRKEGRFPRKLSQTREVRERKRRGGKRKERGEKGKEEKMFCSEKYITC